VPDADLARIKLRSNALGHLLLELRRHEGRTQVLPPVLDRPAQVRQHMRDAARAARQVQVHEGTHHCPAQPRALRNRRVDVGHRGHALVDQMEGLAPKRRLQPVGNVPLDLALHVDRPLADGGVEGHCTLDGVGRGALAADHFHQRNQVRRIEGMPQHHAIRMRAARLHAADRQPRGAGGQDRVQRRGGVHAAEQIDLEIQALGAVFLHEVRVAQGVFQRSVKAQPLHRGALRQPEALQRGPVLRHGLAQPRLRARGRVGGIDVQTLREEPGGPAGADHAGADHRDAPDGRGHLRHLRTRP
jgi:hypothetical protein